MLPILGKPFLLISILMFHSVALGFLAEDHRGHLLYVLVLKCFGDSLLLCRDAVYSNMPYFTFFLYTGKTNKAAVWIVVSLYVEKVKHTCEHLFQLSLEKIYV